MPPIEQLPPFSQEAEEAVLGSCLVDPDALLRVRPVLQPGDFYIVKHGWVYEAMLDLAARQHNLDAVTMRVELEKRGQLDEIGGPAYLTYLMTAVPTAIYAEGYAQIVHEKALRRKLLRGASDIAQLAYDETGNVVDQLSVARSKIASIEIPVDNVETAASVVARVAAQVEDRYDNPLKPGEVIGMATGLIDFDVMTGGLSRKVLDIFAARPGMGKTSLLVQVGFELARREGRRVLVCSLEMSKEELMYRQLSRLTDLTVKDLQAGRIPDDRWPDVIRAQEILADLPVYIYDVSTPSLAHIESVILKHGPFDVVILDHLALMAEVRNADDRAKVNAIGRVSSACKAMAKTHNLCFCLVSQLSRKCEERDNKRPLLSDLRDSGTLEQDADDVYVLYRDDYYHDDSQSPNVCEVIPRKRRNDNPFNKCDLYWIGRTTSFKNLVKRDIAL